MIKSPEFHWGINWRAYGDTATGPGVPLWERVKMAEGMDQKAGRKDFEIFHHEEG